MVPRPRSSARFRSLLMIIDAYDEVTWFAMVWQIVGNSANGLRELVSVCRGLRRLNPITLVLRQNRYQLCLSHVVSFAPRWAF